MATYVTQPTAMKTLRVIVSLALIATAVAVIAGAWLWAADPTEGTTLYDTLGATAASSGLAAGGLFIAAAIWAQAKDLWQHVPSWARLTVMALVVIAAVVPIANSVLS